MTTPVQDMLHNVVGFPTAGATALLAEGYGTLEAISGLDEDEVHYLCKNIRKPGGPSATAPGVAIPHLAEQQLILLAFMLRTKKLCSRPLVLSDVTLPNILAHKSLQKSLKKYKDPETEFDVVPLKDNWPKIFELLIEHISKFRGKETMVSLGYVIRTEATVVASVDDPLTNYSDMDAQQIARCPIFMGTSTTIKEPSFQAENAQVWTILHDIFCTTPTYQYMKRFAKTKDGRGAFLALIDTYLGKMNTNLLASKYEKERDNLIYTGDKRNFTFQKYIDKHVEFYNILQGLKEHGYHGVDDDTRVRKFVEGVKTPLLDVPCSRCSGKPGLTFETAVRTFLDYIQQRFPHGVGRTDPRSISQVDVEKDPRGGKRKDRPRSGDRTSLVSDVALRYYSKEEYKKLSTEDKNALRLARKKNGKGGNNGRNAESATGPSVSALNKQTISKLAKMTAAAISASTLDKDMDDLSIDSEATPPSGNRSNTALSRQKKKQRNG